MLDAFFRASAIRAVCGRLRVGVRGRGRARLRARARASAAARARASAAARVTALRDVVYSPTCTMGRRPNPNPDAQLVLRLALMP